MRREKPHVIDAEFEVVQPARPTQKWWQGWYLDWRVIAVVGATSLTGLIATLTKQ
jgi:hypothetical protein